MKPSRCPGGGGLRGFAMTFRSKPLRTGLGLRRDVDDGGCHSGGGVTLANAASELSRVPRSRGMAYDAARGRKCTSAARRAADRLTLQRHLDWDGTDWTRASRALALAPVAPWAWPRRRSRPGGAHRRRHDARIPRRHVDMGRNGLGRKKSRAFALPLGLRTWRTTPPAARWCSSEAATVAQTSATPGPGTGRTGRRGVPRSRSHGQLMGMAYDAARGQDVLFGGPDRTT